MEFLTADEHLRELGYWLGPNSSTGDEEPKGLALHIYIYIHRNGKLCPETSYFQKKKTVSDRFLPFLTTFCIQVWVYVYMYMYMYNP